MGFFKSNNADSIFYMNVPHNFHIPVLGVCYTVDSPLKVARYGISSVVSIIEDELLEDMRRYHSLQNGIEYRAISNKETDKRAKRITAYLDLLQQLVDNQINELRCQPFTEGSDISNYFEHLPDRLDLKKKYLAMIGSSDTEIRSTLESELRSSITAGAIDVNIMAKVDNFTYDTDGNKMPDEFSDALSALRGFAKSRLHSAVVFSAGYNPRLYNYLEQFDDFYPSEGQLSKKVILKVSDFRSAVVQGKVLAKKGIWVSEFRIESGLNCGGHAFPTEGSLLGPILEEFKTNRKSLANELFTICNEALIAKGKSSFTSIPVQKVSAQGGVGTAEEHLFLLEYFQLDSIGWGSPFLLVPEVTNVDQLTLKELSEAQPEDFFVSNASPLGVPFHNFRKSSSEAQRKSRIEKSRAGSPCYKKLLSSNTEFTDLPICTASRQYLQLKEKQLKSSNDSNASELLKQAEEKDCLCEGLSSAARLKNDIPLSHNLPAVTICPGPNLAWFSGIFSLKEMVGHIYGRMNITNQLYRPHVFINELKLYVTYIEEQVSKSTAEANEKHSRYLKKFIANLLSGIQYYKNLLSHIANNGKTLEELCLYEQQLVCLVEKKAFNN